MDKGEVAEKFPEFKIRSNLQFLHMHDEVLQQRAGQSALLREEFPTGQWVGERTLKIHNLGHVVGYPASSSLMLTIPSWYFSLFCGSVL